MLVSDRKLGVGHLMARYLVTLGFVLLASCAGSSKAVREAHPPHYAPDQKPDVKDIPATDQEMNTFLGPKAAEPEPEDHIDSKDLKHLGQWLLVLASHVGQNLERATQVCAVFEQDLTFIKDDELGHWFNCGGEGGYLLAFDDTGKVIYIAEGSAPFNVENLTALTGEPAEQSVDGSGFTVYNWKLQLGRAAEPLVLSLLTKGAVHFVAIRSASAQQMSHTGTQI